MKRLLLSTIKHPLKAIGIFFLLVALAITFIAVVVFEPAALERSDAYDTF